MAEKSYKDLEAEVWETGRCARCGACIAVCPADALSFPENAHGHPVSSSYCKMECDDVPCGACYLACPRVADGADPAKPLGDYISAVSARATFPVPGKQSGGAVTAVLVHALEAGLVDAVVTVSEDRWTRKPQSVVITDREALVAQAGSRYNWWVPLLAALKEAVVVRKYRRVAVVAVPCAAEAVARIRTSGFDLHGPYARAIRLLVGLFCTESFDYTALMEGKIRGDLGIEPWEVERLDVKGYLEVTRLGGGTETVPLADLEGCIPEGCRHCTDFAAVHADISAGAVGSPKGYSTLLVRTDAGRGFVAGAVAAGLLVVDGEADLAKVEALAKRKVARSRQE
ncbi:MAG: Coenzyme F420 hydrogenase/dehydrogenase, beta subunit C-terminal domain [Methanofollis sp.]|uniref:Coenzyme F420 hydrogenase/dehydrogenase, beta subunit C-terminal domain n=1 Tax=Methanofollis sp. TaxID=2052835 RepID=UPI0026214AC6|nr:Coenzyme F420 hydrogenase/dehydrogenase, beta subunit C-terminal domain [Methanofollis sp.]MDD4254561.1 Coenzyme F420 hydrogenase/dehydrogenase, beta subunit C-terminal domain [Methanofollis sp.]